ncbi:MAG: CpsD/CapB family tyrosine-protein kinase [Alicyclobacillus sp.]|nr:CpsD/CapB family tyrosine-protein kinase [Alicyclobacillus sp.]
MSLSERSPRPLAQTNPKSPVVEAYRTIRTNLQFASAVEDVQVVLATSTLPAEGKTSTVCNVGVVTAEAGRNVLLIDADLRKPQIHQRFQVTNLRGLSSLLIRESTFEEALVESGTPGLTLLPSGPIPPNPSELLSSKRFTEILEAARQSYDLILVDSPPVLSVADALVLSRAADGVLFVVDAQNTNRKLAQKAVSSLRQINARVLGTVLNRMKHEPGDGYYYYSYYNSGPSTSA